MSRLGLRKMNKLREWLTEGRAVCQRARVLKAQGDPEQLLEEKPGQSGPWWEQGYACGGDLVTKPSVTG